MKVLVFETPFVSVYHKPQTRNFGSMSQNVQIKRLMM